jgi:monoamine oxidase
MSQDSSYEAAGTDSAVATVVVGAGLSGLSAAHRLAQAGQTVRVLEARDRVGGRIVNISIGEGVITEGGGQYIGVTQNRLQALADAYGVETYPTFSEGSTLALVNGSPAASMYEAPEDNDLLDLIARLQQLADQVPVEQPWTARSAAEWDALTVEDWIRAESTTTAGGELLRSVARMMVGSEPEDVSLLFFAYYIASAGNEQEKGSLVRLITTKGGAQDRRFVGGSVRVAEAMADDLGGAVSLSSPVRRIEYSDGAVRVLTDDATVRARHVVIAIPPPLANEIQFDPPLPDAHARLLEELHVGSVSKLQAVYEDPFWRSDGNSGHALMAGEPFQAVFENSPPEGRPGVLFGFASAADSRRLAAMNPDQRRDTVLELFTRVVGARAAEPRLFLGIQWGMEEWSRGGPGPTAGPGVLTGSGTVLRESVGPLHFAGTERAVYWTGYMEGAVRAGEDAADRILRAVPT